MRKFDFNGIIRYFNYRSEQGVFVRVVRDWKILFVCFVVLAVLFAFTDGYLFWKYHKELNLEIKAAVLEEKLITVNKEKLQSVLEELDRKKEQFEKKLSAPYLKDPAR